jgi:hypothetical protein
MDKELDLHNALKAERQRKSEKFAEMTEAIAEFVNTFSDEENANYDDILRRFVDYGRRTLQGQIAFDRLLNEAKTDEERLQAITRGSATIERDNEELTGFIAELRDILRTGEPKDP